MKMPFSSRSLLPENLLSDSKKKEGNKGFFLEFHHV